MAARLDRVFASTLRIGMLQLEQVHARAGDESAAAELNRYAATLRSRFGDLEIGSIPGVAAARELYRSLGIDPTRTRPASEALLRRALRGLTLPAIHPAVDVANLVSLRALLPVGLYDADRVEDDVTIRVGRAGEGYPGIGKEWVNLEGRIAVCDDAGPFGNPTSDSGRTRVTESTRRLLFLVFAPFTAAAADVLHVLDEATKAYRRHVDARPSAAGLVGAG